MFTLADWLGVNHTCARGHSLGDLGYQYSKRGYSLECCTDPALCFRSALDGSALIILVQQLPQRQWRCLEVKERRPLSKVGGIGEELALDL